VLFFSVGYLYPPSIKSFSMDFVFPQSPRFFFFVFVTRQSLPPNDRFSPGKHKSFSLDFPFLFPRLLKPQSVDLGARFPNNLSYTFFYLGALFQPVFRPFSSSHLPLVVFFVTQSLSSIQFCFYVVLISRSLMAGCTMLSWTPPFYNQWTLTPLTPLSMPIPPFQAPGFFLFFFGVFSFEQRFQRQSFPPSVALPKPLPAYSLFSFFVTPLISLESVFLFWLRHRVFVRLLTSSFSPFFFPAASNIFF